MEDGRLYDWNAGDRNADQTTSSSISQQRKNKKTWTTRTRLEISFPGVSHPLRSCGKSNKKKQFPSTNNNIDHNLFVPIDFFT
jgi:hypothetical protein